MRFMPFAVPLALNSHLSPTLLPGELRTKHLTAVVQTVTASVTVWLRETRIGLCLGLWLGLGLGLWLALGLGLGSVFTFRRPDRFFPADKNFRDNVYALGVTSSLVTIGENNTRTPCHCRSFVGIGEPAYKKHLDSHMLGQNKRY